MSGTVLPGTGVPVSTQPVTTVNGGAATASEVVQRIVVAAISGGAATDISPATETTVAAINATLTAGTVQLAAGGAVGATPSTRAIQVSGSDYAGTPLARAIKVDSTGLQYVALPTGAAQDGTDITSPTAMPAGGSGIRGWLSAIWTKLNGLLSVNITSSQGNVAAVSQVISATVANTPGVAVTTSSSAQAVANVAASGNSTFHLVATAFAGTVVFEASLDGGLNYAPIIAIREDGTGSESSAVLSIAAAFIRTYTVGLPGFTHFRVRCSAFTSGTLAVYITQGPFLLEPNPGLSAGYNLIGQIQQRGADLVVSSLGTAATALTATLPAPGAGLFHYITAIEIIRLNPTATAVAAAASIITITTTNLPGSLAWSIGNAIAAGGYDVPVRLTPNNPIKSSAANTATTIVCPSGGTGVQFRVNVVYYTGA